jgi:glycosyltransferase involved in cell wall biosynthesis
MKSLKISVIIPTRNSGRYLAQTLATVYKQEYKPSEVIIVDGSSTDNTREIVEVFSSFITSFISEPDRGQLDAVQKGIRMATGDILYWINADDAVMPGTFSRAAKAFAEDPSVEIVYGDNYWFDEANRRFGVAHSVKRLTFWDQFLFYGQIQVESFFWRRELSDKALPFDTNLRVYTDYSFFLPIRYGAKCKWIPYRLGAFRVHSEQMSTVNHDRGDAERALIKQRMCVRLGLSKDEYHALQKKHRLRYIMRHKIIPKAISAIRYAGRKLTGDYMRNKIARFFFEEWLQPPMLNKTLNLR